MKLQKLDPRLEEYKRVWDNKKIIRTLYSDFYQQINSKLKPGKTLEIGGGCGNFRAHCSTDLVSSDIQYAPWLDLMADAQSLPFANQSFDNIVMIDVLHHIDNVKNFFSESSRILSQGGKIILLEPGITPLSWVLYKMFHEEIVDMSVDPMSPQNNAIPSDPYDSNQAIPTLLFGKKLKAFNRAFPELRLVQKKWLSLFAYPLSGGYQKWALIPHSFIKPMLVLESVLSPLIGRVFGFRLLLVLEKQQ